MAEFQFPIGIVCEKHRDASRNGCTFPPLAECREAWSQRYGATMWDTDMIDWGEEEQPTVKPKPKVVVEPKPEPPVPKLYRRY